jgi:GntR family transcriptional repressor for pyruvate dehydrogenase complex
MIESESMIFEPLKSRRHFEEIADQIRAMIGKGSFRPGDRLPPEKEMARQFQVGRQAVREALRLLEISGLVKVKKGSRGGIFITDLSTENVTTSISNIITLRNISLKDLTEVRLELEKIILVHAIQRITHEDLIALEDSILRAEKRLASGDAPTQENVEFHLILSRATRNEMFHILMESVMKLVSQFLRKLNPSPEQSKRVLEEHRSLLKLVKEKDPHRSVEQMERHLIGIEKRLSSLMGRKKTSKGG